MADTNIIDAEDLITGSTVSAPENITFGDSTPGVSSDLNAQIAKAKTQALAIQDSLAKQAEAEKLAKEETDKTTDLTAAKEEQQTWLEKIMSGGDTTRAEIRETEEEDEGVSEKEDLLSGQAIKVAGIQGEIDKLEVAKQAEIASARANPTVIGNIEGAIDEIERKYDTQKASLAAVLSGEAALMNAYQGNLDLAKGNVTDAVNDYMYDYDQEVERYKFVYDYYGDWVDSLEADQKTALDRAYNEAQQVKVDTRKDLEYKQGLWTRAAEQGVNIPFEDLKNMTTDEAAKWYAEKVSAMVAEEKVVEDGAREMTDEEIRAEIKLDTQDLITGGFDEEYIYDRIRSGIMLDDTVANKDRALFILDEQSGKAGGKTFEQWKAGEPATEEVQQIPALKEANLFGGATAGELQAGTFTRGADGKPVFGTSTSEVDKKSKDEEANKRVRELLSRNSITKQADDSFLNFFNL